jgi:fructose-1,6-bisphosphatase/sedoheptulose 1,7-bisphosphatase-like protein
MNTIVEKVAIAIAEEYADQRDAAPQIAEQLVAIAEAEGIPLLDLFVWIHDRPRHELSTFALRSWRKRVGLK